ncbi:MAG: hypothetical protein TUN42_04305 [Dehalogenimonas sp.]
MSLKCNNMREFQSMRAQQIIDACPVILSANGQPACIIGKPEDVVIISDWPPLMKARIEGLVQMVCAGQPNCHAAVLRRVLKNGYIYSEPELVRNDNANESADS